MAGADLGLRSQVAVFTDDQFSGYGTLEWYQCRTWCGGWVYGDFEGLFGNFDSAGELSVDGFTGDLFSDGLLCSGGRFDFDWTKQTEFQVACVADGGLWMVSGAGSSYGLVWEEEHRGVEYLGSEQGQALSVKEIPPIYLILLCSDI